MVYQNGKAVAMSLASDNEASQPSQPSQDIYSTEEQVIGRWIDGKPLYRIVKNGVFNAASNVSIKLVELPAGIEQLVTLRGMKSSNEFFTIVPSSTLLAPFNKIENIGYTYMWYSKVDHFVWGRASSDSQTNPNPCVIVAEYTKTTDSASFDKTMSVSAPEAVSVPASSAKTVDEI